MAHRIGNFHVPLRLSVAHVSPHVLIARINWRCDLRSLKLRLSCLPSARHGRQTLRILALFPFPRRKTRRASVGVDHRLKLTVWIAVKLLAGAFKLSLALRIPILLLSHELSLFLTHLRDTLLALHQPFTFSLPFALRELVCVGPFVFRRRCKRPSLIELLFGPTRNFLAGLLLATDGIRIPLHLLRNLWHNRLTTQRPLLRKHTTSASQAGLLSKGLKLILSLQPRTKCIWHRTQRF